MNAYFNGFKVIIQEYYETYNEKGQCCRYAKCFIPKYDATEGILLSDIYIA